nr:hypothetical protein [uncultured Rhodoferax sp.]
MRRTLWITLLSLALALSAYSSGARSAPMPLHGDCCETMCHDMPGCAAMVVCQACTAPAASMARAPAFAFTPGVVFARSGHDRAPDGPVHPIWSPPD